MSTPTSPLIWVNGELDHQLSALDRGLAYGDGLFETCRLHNGRIPLWSRHLQRLLASSAVFAIELNTKQLESWVDTALALLREQNIRQGTFKLILTRGVGGRGYQQPHRVAPTIVLMVQPDNLELLTARPTPARLKVCRMRLGRNRVLAGHKHLNRLESVLARAEWQDNTFDEGLMLDDRANVIEATSHNVFIYRKGCWHTPVLDESGVAGVMRQLVLDELAPRCGVRVTVAPLSLDAVYSAEEVMLCNSNRGVRPVAAIADDAGALHQFSHHNNALRLSAALSDFLQGKGSGQ